MVSRNVRTSKLRNKRFAKISIRKIRFTALRRCGNKYFKKRRSKNRRKERRKEPTKEKERVRCENKDSV